MKTAKSLLKRRTYRTEQPPPPSGIDQTTSAPDVPLNKKLLNRRDQEVGKPSDGQSASESQLTVINIKDETQSPRLAARIDGVGDTKSVSHSRSETTTSTSADTKDCNKLKMDYVEGQKVFKDRNKCSLKQNIPKKLNACPAQLNMEADDLLLRQIRDIHNDARKSTRIIRDSRARLLEIQKKATITEADVKELGERNDLLLREMERFHNMTKSMQKLVGGETQKKKDDPKYFPYLPGGVYESPLHHEMKMDHPSILLAGPRRSATPSFVVSEPPTRSKSEIDLTRKLTESYDMQEKLAADNADLEVKRYILYKELMTKDQSLETCRAQVKRLQGELKLINNENFLLNERLSKNNPEGDATSVNQTASCQVAEVSKQNENTKHAEELISRLENYKSSTLDLEKQLASLEGEVKFIKSEMDGVNPKTGRPHPGQMAPWPQMNSTMHVAQAAGSACRGGSALGPNTCFEQPPGPPVPPMTKACGVCPPCPAPCNPNAPLTPSEKEVQKLTIQLRQTEENFKTKVAECAMLRTELLKKKDELDKERCQHREVQNKLRELEMKFEGLTTHTNMLLGTKEQALEQEVNVRALKQCYREAREEIDELRTLMKEQNDQLQDYRVKYLQAQQLVEEQKRQMDLMDMDNTRISEQINLEIQKVKLKFQEKLQELAPIPEVLKATQMRLKDSQQSQAIAEHNAEQLARELNCAREKVHVLLHNTIKPPEKNQDKNDDKQIQLLQQRITQLTESNMGLRSEIDRLKSNVIRMEEAVLANEKRLQEKMHECAQLGGDLDRTRDEAARALQRAHERTETIRKCMQTSIAELERQLAASRAQVKTTERDREELQCRMQCQIRRLNDNFEQAQLRIMGLQTQVSTLRRTASSTADGDGDIGEAQECACKSFFDNP